MSTDIGIFNLGAIKKKTIVANELHIKGTMCFSEV